LIWSCLLQPHFSPILIFTSPSKFNRHLKVPECTMIPLTCSLCLNTCLFQSMIALVHHWITIFLYGAWYVAGWNKWMETGRESRFRGLSYLLFPFKHIWSCRLYP
jgi:hypothetical protein